MITEEEIKKVLSQIIDPELGADIVTLGFVKGIEIENGKVTIKLKLTIPGCPLMNLFLEEIKERVKKIKEVSEVKVELKD
jgi:metal-sulfur cluster biosynthetic enzyme